MKVLSPAARHHPAPAGVWWYLPFVRRPLSVLRLRVSGDEQQRGGCFYVWLQSTATPLTMGRRSGPAPCWMPRSSGHTARQATVWSHATNDISLLFTLHPSQHHWWQSIFRSFSFNKSFQLLHTAAAAAAAHLKEALLTYRRTVVLGNGKRVPWWH